MIQVIDGTNAVMGRLASYVAKQALLGEEIAVVNCEKVIVTGNRDEIRQKFEYRRRKIGSGQKGPKYSRLAHLIVKRAIRGMLDHRAGRGKVAFQRIKCYAGVPLEFKDAKMIQVANEKKKKFVYVAELTKGK